MGISIFGRELIQDLRKEGRGLVYEDEKGEEKSGWWAAAHFGFLVDFVFDMCGAVDPVHCYRSPFRHKLYESVDELRCLSDSVSIGGMPTV